MTKITQLPFDLYSRHHLAASLVERVFRKKGESLNILDLGGYAGKTEYFFKNDKVTVLDIYDVQDQKNYVKGDATNLQFNDNTFDIVTNFDVFEHIPREARKKFIKEAFRVSSRAVILTFPIDHEEARRSTSEAEMTLDQFYKTLAGSRHPWLREHIDYGIPSSAEFESILNGLGIAFTKLSSNSIESWKMMQVVNFLGTVDEASLKQAKILNQLYNTHIEGIETGITNGYRAIYVLFKDHKYRSVTDKVIAEMYQDRKSDESITDEQFQKIAFQTIITLLARATKQSKKITQEYNATVLRQQQADAEVHRLQDEISRMHESSSWRITAPLRKIKRVVKK